MIRMTRSLLLGTLVVALGLGAAGCSGGGDAGSPEKGKENAKKAAEGMRQMQTQTEKKRGGAGGGAEEDQKEKEKAKDNGK